MDENKPSTSKQFEDENDYESDSSTDSSNDEKCPICLLSFTSDQEIGKPAVCEHSFCFPCIQEWSKVVQPGSLSGTCPIDRKEFQEIHVYGNLECDNLLRTVIVKEKVALAELIGADDVTACEICENTDREDCMLLCDGCDKGLSTIFHTFCNLMKSILLLGFHMDCLDPPLLEIPQGNWYCDECFDSSDESEDEDPEEVDDLMNDVEEEIGELPEARLRTRQHQPQILRTMQSERIRNAILARMSLRGAREALGGGPSMAAPATTRPKTVQRRRTARKRKTRRRAKTVVVEYDVDGSDKFAMKTRRVAKRRRTRKKRRKAGKVSKRKTVKTAKAFAGPSTSFKGVNSNVHDLQRGRMMAGLSNFNIFQPTNLLDYVPDEDDAIDDSGIEESGEGNVLTQAIIGLSNPQRRNMMIKNRVLQNCTTTSNVSDLLDSILQDQDMFGPGSIGSKFAVEKSSGKLLFKGKNTDGVKQASDGDNNSGNGEAPRSTENNTANTEQPREENDVNVSGETTAQKVNDDRDEPENLPSEIFDKDNSPQDKKKKPKKPEIDMFDENPEEAVTEDCPNFSIYDSVDAQDNSSSFQNRPNAYDEENVDLVQMSDNNESSEEAPPAIVASQPASPDEVSELAPERSYTPPIVQKTSEDGPERDDEDSDKRKRDKRNRKRDSSVKRYNVRDRLKEKSPVKLKDKFGRNRSRSSSRKKHSRKRSRSGYRKSRSPDRYRKSFTRSRSRRRTPSIEYDRKKKSFKDKSKKASRRSRSRSFTPRSHRPTTPDRRARSRSKKAKKKKHRDYSKEKPSTLTKEVFTSGQNILVSVNFNNQEEKNREKDDREPKEIVDITARKKITVSSKPVAIIDLARSPFRELTPEYQSNVIELSDSEGEKTNEKQPPKSPDSSSKLYDPFDILNSPTNENVTSSQNSAAANVQKLLEKLPEPVKISMTYNKNIMALAANNLFSSFEENLVSSSSSMMQNDKLLPQLMPAKVDDKSASKNETIPMDIAESPYSPGREYDDPQDDNDVGPTNRTSKGANKSGSIFEDLFGSSTPPGLDRVKSSGKKGKKLNIMKF